MESRLESLLQHREWVHDLARRLVRDPELADELEQETWLTVLQSPTGPVRSTRGWLASILRSRLLDRTRSEARRESREQGVARDEAMPSTEDLVQRTAAQQHVVETVLALPEAYREVVLRRFFENEPPRVIAERLEIPVATVKTRLSRAIQQLREKLDEQNGGDGKRWVLALAPLVREPAGSLAPGVGLWVLGALSTCAVLLGVAALGWGRPAPKPSSPGTAKTELASAAAMPTDELPALPARRTDAVRALPTASVDAGSFRRPGTTRPLPGRVIDVEGRPRAGVLVGFQRAGRGESETQVAVSDSEGRFELRIEPSRGVVRSLSQAHATAWAGFYGGDDGSEGVDLVVAPSVAVTGEVVDALGAPLSGVEVRLDLPQRPPASSGARLAQLAAVAPSTRSDENGRFELVDLPRVAGARLVVDAAARGRRELALEEAAGQWLSVVLSDQRELVLRVRGRVLDPTGQALEGAAVSDGHGVAWTDAQGVFELGAEQAPQELVASAAGYLPVRRETFWESGTDTSLTEQQVEFRMQAPALSIRGRVLAPDGAGLGGIWVWVDDPQPLFVPIDDDKVHQEQSGHLPGMRNLRAPAPLLESVLAGEPERTWGRVRTNEQGVFLLEGLDRRSYRISAMDRARLLRVDLDGVTAGREDVVLAMDPERLESALEGRVVDERGEAIEGVLVGLQRRGFALSGPRGPVWSETVRRAGALTDAEGRFRIGDVPPGELRLCFEGEGVVPVSVPPGSGVAEESTYELRRSCRLRVRLPEDSLAREFRVLDASGAPLELVTHLGHRLLRSERAPLVLGASDEVHVGLRAASVEVLGPSGVMHSIPFRPVVGALVELTP